ncbi:MAG: 6-phosphogluconolactonase [Elusimicrobia bacterium GWC2_64_44]|nr:MAG: 6-phosphogluconolactonase [Elusimicrobia bacterium GWC2_64_44]
MPPLKNKPLVKRFRSPESMADYAAGLFARLLRRKKTGAFLAALSGGRTPAALFGALAGLKLDWARVHFFMADERLVPPDSPFSNFGQARELLFSKIPIPAANLHPPGVRQPAQAAKAYEKEITKLAGPSGALDLVFLGLGSDGHTASLFPGARTLSERKRLVVPAKAPPGVRPAARITLTFKALNAAGAAVLLAAGPDKKDLFARTAAGDKALPAARVRPAGGLYLLFSEK